MLSDDEIARYARQIVIPGIGAAGQQKLLSSTVLVVGDERGCEQAALYLRAAGVRVVDASGSNFDVAVVADADVLTDEMRARLLAAGKPVCWYADDEQGFQSGVHPDARLPSRGASSRSARAGLADAAASEVAALACAVLIGLPYRAQVARFGF
jgi:hypothetical protein